MGKDTKIGWTDSTINGTSGCDGCELYRPDEAGEDSSASCYAKAVHETRLAKTLPHLYAAKFNEVRLIPGRFQKAAKWADLRGVERPDKPWLNGKPRHIFVGDMGDILSDAVPQEFLKRELIGAITSKNGSRHIWQILTKRPERLAAFSETLGGLPDNVVAMTTVTNQRTADVRIPALLRVRCKTRGVSCEPLRGPVDLSKDETVQWCNACGAVTPTSELGGTDFKCGRCGDPRTRERSLIDYLDWVIVGGESGRLATPVAAAWIRSLRDQCAAARVAFFMKQWGEWIPGRFDRRKGKMICEPASADQTLGPIFWTNPGAPAVHLWDEIDHYWTSASARLGKASTGSLLDGVDHKEMPRVAHS